LGLLLSFVTLAYLEVPQKGLRYDSGFFVGIIVFLGYIPATIVLETSSALLKTRSMVQVYSVVTIFFVFVLYSVAGRKMNWPINLSLDTNPNSKV
jgi:hypothetical protein